MQNFKTIKFINKIMFDYIKVSEKLKTLSDSQLLQIIDECRLPTLPEDCLLRNLIVEFFGTVDIPILQIGKLVWPMLEIVSERLTCHSPIKIVHDEEGGAFLIPNDIYDEFMKLRYEDELSNDDGDKLDNIIDTYWVGDYNKIQLFISQDELKKLTNE